MFIRETRPPPQVYVAVDQTEEDGATFILRAAGPIPATINAARAAVHRVDPTLPPPRVGAFASMMAQRQSGSQMYAMVASTLGVLAVALSAFGLASLLAYDVAQRTREIGVRVALGASRSRVLGLVIRDGMKITGAGVLVGVFAAAAASRILARHLYGVSPLEPLSGIGAIVLILAVSLLACWLPARRAARVDPLVALRCE